MVEEKKENGVEIDAHVIDLNLSEQIKLHPVKQMKGVIGEPWHSEFMENKINFLT